MKWQRKFANFYFFVTFIWLITIYVIFNPTGLNQ